jgi:Uma2 family endonuclease
MSRGCDTLRRGRGAATLKTPPLVEIQPVKLRLWPVINLSDDQLAELCQLNSELRIERTAEGELFIMPPTLGETGDQESELIWQLRTWAKQDQTGSAFGSSVGFSLPNGALRSPDASWVSRARLATLTREQKRRFFPLCPDFVIELRSSSDSLKSLQAKMEEYIQNGAQLGWLLDPRRRRVYVYRPQRQVEILENPATLSGDPELPGFVLSLQEIWEPRL